MSNHEKQSKSSAATEDMPTKKPRRPFVDPILFSNEGKVKELGNNELDTLARVYSFILSDQWGKEKADCQKYTVARSRQRSGIQGGNHPPDEGPAPSVYFPE